MKPIPIYIYFEALSFLASLTLYFQAGTPRYMKSFPPFLLLTVVVEVIGWRFAKHRQTILGVYDIFAVVTSTFYLYILKKFIHNLKVRTIIQRVIWVYLVIAALTNIYFIQIHRFNFLSFALGCLIIVTVCIYYFFELFQLPQSINLLRDQAFWITSGLLFFHCCSFMFISLTNFVAKLSATIFKNLNYILQIIIVLFYIMFTIGFLCRLKIRKPNTLN